MGMKRKEEEEEIKGLYRGKDLASTASNFFDRMNKRPVEEEKEDAYAPERRRFRRLESYVKGLGK